MPLETDPYELIIAEPYVEIVAIDTFRWSVYSHAKHRGQSWMRKSSGLT